MGGKRKPLNFSGIVLVAVFLSATVLFLTKCSNPTAEKVKPQVNVFTVFFETSGGSPVPENMTVDAGSTIEPPEEAIKKSGFSLNGWCKDEDCTEFWDFEHDTVTKNVTLYANWKPGKKGGGGGGGGSSSSSGNSGSTGTQSGPVDPTVNWPTDLWAEDGWTLSQITVPGNGTGTAGNFEWVLDGTTPVGTPGIINTFRLKFIPTSTSSFNTVDEDVDVIVYFRVNDAIDLNNIGKKASWTLEKFYKQTADIPLTGTFEAIGKIGDPSTEDPFKGVYDGGGYVITGLDVVATSNYQGMFGNVKYGKIRNVTIEGGL